MAELKNNTQQKQYEEDTKSEEMYDRVEIFVSQQVSELKEEIATSTLS